jgi:hypothetical protein
MSTAGWKLAWLGKEVSDQGDLAVVGEIKKHRPVSVPSGTVISIQLTACCPSPTIRCTAMCHS